jgi:hypothetical protein
MRHGSRPRKKLKEGIVMKKITTLLIVMYLGLLLAASTCFAQKITTFDVPNSIMTQPVGISPAGEITGTYWDGNVWYGHGFVRDRNGKFVTIEIPDTTDNGYTWAADRITPTAINPAGQITGEYSLHLVGAGTGVPRTRGFLRDRDGTLATFGVPNTGVAPGRHVHPKAINPEGAIAGYTDPDDFTFTAFLRQPDGTFINFYWSDSFLGLWEFTGINPSGEIVGHDGLNQAVVLQPDGTIVRFSAGYCPQSLHGCPTSPQALNPAGQVTGSYGDGSGRSKGFLRDAHGTIINFEVPNSTNTIPLSINARGQLTGIYTDATYLYHGFLRESNGTISTFDVPNATYTNPTAICSTGEITGWYVDTSNRVHGFVRSR